MCSTTYPPPSDTLAFVLSRTFDQSDQSSLLESISILNSLSNQMIYEKIISITSSPLLGDDTTNNMFLNVLECVIQIQTIEITTFQSNIFLLASLYLQVPK